MAPHISPTVLYVIGEPPPTARNMLSISYNVKNLENQEQKMCSLGIKPESPVWQATEPIDLQYGIVNILEILCRLLNMWKLMISVDLYVVNKPANLRLLAVQTKLSTFST